MCILAVGCLVGCSGSKDEVLPVAKATTRPIVTPVPVTPKKTGQRFEIVSEGKVWGTAKINQIEKLKFGDWSNSQARMNDVNYCYSYNITITPEVVNDSVTVKTEPVVYRDGSKISSPADVGWSGFPKVAEFYSGGDSSITVEVCSQPEKKVRGSDIFMLEFSIGEKEAESVQVAGKSVKQAKKGNCLLSVKDEVIIKSVNGAKYSVTPKKVYFEEHYQNASDRDAGTGHYFDISYQVKAIRAPVKNVRVDNVKGTGKNARLVCQGVLGLQPQDSATVLYHANTNAGRVNYRDTDDLFTYVDEGAMLRFGYLRKVQTNRVAPEGANLGMQFVRLRVEFPEETKNRSRKELLKFNGRYLVYEIPITDRKLGLYFK